MSIKIDTVIIESDPVSRELIRSYLGKVEDINIIGEFDDAINSYAQISELHPNLIIVDISQRTQLTLDIIVKISKNLRNAKIVVISYDMDSQTVIKALRAGAREYLVKPLIESDFIDSVEKIKDLILGNINDTTKCKVITTFSNKGGMGKTSIAANLAVEIANLTKEKVALVDLNFQMGDITTFLDLNPAFDTSYVVNNLERIDETFLLSTLEKYKDTSLYVLADPPDLEQAEVITSENITTLINVLRSVFSYVIIDTTSSFDGKTITALDNSDLILLIAVLNLPSVRNCQRCFDLFKRLGYQKDKIKLIVNRYMENDEIKIEDVEDVLGYSVYYKIPNNYFAIINAMNKGMPVSDLNHQSNIAKAFRELAALLSDNYTYSATKQTKQDERGFLGLFKKKEKK